MTDTTTTIDYHKMTTTDAAGRPRYNVSFEGKYLGRVERDNDGDWAARTAIGTVAWENTRGDAASEILKAWRKFTDGSETRRNLWADATHEMLVGQFNDKQKACRRAHRAFIARRRTVRRLTDSMYWIDRAEGLNPDVGAYVRSAIALIEGE